MSKKKTVLSLAMIDQAVVSLGSLLFLISAAQGLTPEGLGVFALAISTTLFAQSLTRSFVGEVFIVGKEGWNRSVLNSGLSASLLIVTLTSTLCILLALSFADLSIAFFSSALAAPGVLLQDVFRHWYISNRDSKALVLSDVIAVTLQVTLILVAAITTNNPLLVSAAWGLGALIVATWSFLSQQVRFSVKSSGTWYRRTWRDGSAYASESVMGATLGFGIAIGLAAAHSSSDVAVFRLAMTVFGLTSLLTSFARTSLVREINSTVTRDKPILRIFLTLLFVMTAAVITAWIIVLFLPVEIGILLFGQTWASMLTVAAAATLNRFGATWSVVPAVFLRAMGVAWPVTRVRISVGIVSFGLGPLWAIIDGVRGALIAESVMFFLLFVTLSLLLIRYRRQTDEKDDGVIETDSTA